MKIYVIITKDKGQRIFDYLPEVTASRPAAEWRKKTLEKDYNVTIEEFEVKTAGKNFHSISFTDRIIKMQ